MGLSQHLQSSFRLIATGQLPLLFWMANLYRRGVDIGFVSGDELGYKELRFGHHSITPGPEFRRVLRQLNIQSDDSVIDIGCGKGSALFTLAEFPFRKVVGCEYSEPLLAVAQTNLQKMGQTQVETFQCDATQFDDLDDYSHLFLANPFSSDGFEKLMVNVGKSLQRAPRKLTIIYRNPKSGHVVEQSGLFQKTHEFDYGGLPYTVYEHPSQVPSDGSRIEAEHS